MPTVKGIAPYRDALVVYEYKAADSGETLHVAHWAIVDALPQPSAKRTVGKTYQLTLQPRSDAPATKDVKTSNALDNFDATVWIQTDQSLKLRELSGDQYGCGLTQRMRTLHALRGQLTLLAWGDSRTDQGLNVGLMVGGDGNQAIPRAYNLGIQSSGLDTLEWLTDHYLPHLPKLEWMVLGVAPRMVSQSWDDGEAGKIIASPACRNDVKTDFAAWRDPPAVALTIAQIRDRKKSLQWDARCWGGYDEKNGRLPMKSALRNARPKARRPRWELEVRDWLRLKRIIRRLDERGINVLLFTPPTHPAFGKTAVISEDGISREGHREFIVLLEQLQRRTKGLFVLDVNKGARHDLPADYFADLDHLNHAGRAVLSKRLEAFRKSCKRRSTPTHAGARVDPNAKRAPKGTPKGCQWGRLTKGATIYTDRDYKVRTLPDELSDALLLKTPNDDKTTPSDRQQMTVHFDGPTRVWLAMPEKDDLPAWAVDWTLSRHRIRTDNAEYILIRRDTRRGWGKLNGPGNTTSNYFVIAKALKATGS